MLGPEEVVQNTSMTSGISFYIYSQASGSVLSLKRDAGSETASRLTGYPSINPFMGLIGSEISKTKKFFYTFQVLGLIVTAQSQRFQQVPVYKKA